MWIYIATFALLNVVAWVDEEIKETPLERTLDMLLSLVTLIGLIAYARRFANRALIRAWKAVAPAILIGYVLQLATAWPDMVVADPDLTVNEQFFIVLVALALGTLLLAPAVVINFRFARGRHLITGPT